MSKYIPDWAPITVYLKLISVLLDNWALSVGSSILITSAARATDAIKATIAKTKAANRDWKELDAMMQSDNDDEWQAVTSVVLDIKKKKGYAAPRRPIFFLEVFAKWYSNCLHNYK